MARILILQFDPQSRTPDENFQYIADAVKENTDALVVLPELSFSSYFDYTYISLQKVDTHLNRLRELGRNRKLSFVGSLPVESRGKRYNRGFYLDDEKLQFKDKRNLFGVEQSQMQPGHKNPIFLYKNTPFVYRYV